MSMMKEHFQRKSASVTTSINADVDHSWFSAPPRLDVYDPQMINILLNLAKTNLAGTFTIFEDFRALQSTAEDLIVAMAAVGALYCDVEGSHKVAKACYNDARRITLAAVTTGS